MIAKVIGKSYKVIAYIAIIFMLLVINFNNIFRYSLKQNIYQIIFVTIITMIFILLNKSILKKIDKKKGIGIVAGLLGFLVILEIISAYYFKVERNWDFKWVMDTAEDIATTGSTENMHYFQVFPNNIGALIITTVSMMLTKGSEIGAYITNILFVFLSAIFATLSAYKIGGYKLSINTLLIMILCCPIYLYTPIVYTDTLSIFIPVATLYVWLLAKETDGNKNKYIHWIIIAILAVIGYTLKPVAMIVYIAIIIETLMWSKKHIKQLAISIVIFAILIASYTAIEEKLIIKDSPWTYPYTHWIMMGLNTPQSEGGTSIGWGAYSSEDNAYTGVQPSVELKKEANIKEIKARLKNFGAIGYIKFLFEKFEYVWNDGTYYVLNKIGWDTINKENKLYEYVIGEKSNDILIPYLNNFHEFIMAMGLIGIIIDIARKEKNETIRVMGISMVGIAIFLLIWEARSRYIYFMIPIFCLLASYGICKLSEGGIKKLIPGEANKENIIKNV